MDVVEYRLLDDGSEDSVVTIEIDLPHAKITLMGEVEDIAGGLFVDRVHILIEPPGAQLLTRRIMHTIATRIIEDTGYDEIILRGAARTTGARPGHSPREFRFRRRGGDPTGAQHS